MLRRSTALTALLLAVAVAYAGPTAGAAEPRASLPDIEDEVMCPTCGTVLAHAFSPQAERQRLFIRSLIEQGQDQGADQGRAGGGVRRGRARHAPDEGFDLIAYLVPVGAVVIAAIAIALGLMRWRRRSQISAEPPTPSLSAADSARLEQDLSRYEP